MSAERPDPTPRFGAGELPAEGLQPDDRNAEVRLGRELEGLGASAVVRPSPDFTDRVMAAIDAEPVPAPVVAAGSAVRAGSTAGVLASIRDAFRVAFGTGFPAVARAQALAPVLRGRPPAGGGRGPRPP